MKFTTLYKTTKTGATQVFNIESIGDSYTVTFGQVNGKMQSRTTKCKSKNIGKANETSPSEQAELEATAVWTKKQKANYSTDESAPVMQELPMKVNEYSKHLKKIKASTFTSPKLNGVNCEYRRSGEDRTLELLSRGGEQYPIPAHQEQQVHNLMDILDTSRINGEMYLHGEFLQDIMAATKKTNDLSPKLQFHVFDFPLVPGTYQERCGAMYTLKDANNTKDISDLPFVPVWIANSPEEIEDQFEQVTAAGYEGLIIRNPGGLYEYNTRSLDVFKYKKAQDGEFEVVSYDFDKNGHVVFVCYKSNIHVGEDATFKVKLKGTNEERLLMAANVKAYIGQWLKVEYEMLSKSGTPQKPVGIHFRKVGEQGEALE